MMRVGFIGLGLMGTPMAIRLAMAGHDVAVTSRRHDPGNPALSAGCEWVDHPCDLAGKDVVVTMLPEEHDVRGVLFGHEGVLLTGRSAPLVVDMSTVGPLGAARLEADVLSRGGRFADAPVSGGPAGAASGTLAIMVGADPEVFELVAPVLAPLGTATRLGPVGAGQTAKLANQALIAGIIGGITDAVSLASRRGLALDDLQSAVGSGFGSSPLLEFVLGRVARHDDQPGFKIAHMLKDLRLIEEAAVASGSDARVVGLITRLFDELGPASKELGTQRLVSSRMPAPIDQYPDGDQP